MYALVLAVVPLLGGPSFVITSEADEQVASKLLRLSPEFTATIGARSGETAIKNVISLRRVSSPIPPFPTGRQLLTTTGDRISGKIIGGERDVLSFRPATINTPDDGTWWRPISLTRWIRRLSHFLSGHDGAWLVPMSVTSALWLVDLPADTPPDPARYTWLEGNKNRDVVRLRNGDTIRGVIGMTPDALKPSFRIRPEMGEARDISATEVGAIAFNPLLAKARKPKGPFARVVLADGSRVALLKVQIANGSVKGETGWGQKVEFPLDSLIALDVFQANATYLSDLKPSKVEQVGFLGIAWPWAADRSVRGKPLCLATDRGISTFDKGLGTHPRTLLTYQLGGKYKRFEATVGLDPETGVRGQAVVLVRVDGKEQVVPGLAALAVGQAVTVRVDVSKAKELTMEVDFGPAGGVQADVNWADARLIE
ncbi:MAG: hypothetical protein C0467_29805 [Planctomycetaceae bacterium]|nr:hypothetical protein [Planctomycetaceae bacterium]